MNNYFFAAGCSHRGRITFRDKKPVICGHEHNTEEEAEQCAQAMGERNVGNCQRYEAFKHVCWNSTAIEGSWVEGPLAATVGFDG